MWYVGCIVFEEKRRQGHTYDAQTSCVVGDGELYPEEILLSLTPRRISMASAGQGRLGPACRSRLPGDVEYCCPVFEAKLKGFILPDLSYKGTG